MQLHPSPPNPVLDRYRSRPRVVARAVVALATGVTTFLLLLAAFDTAPARPVTIAAR